MPKVFTFMQSMEQLRKDYDFDGGGTVCWFCPICHTLTLHAEWQKHVRDDHPGHVLKGIHPTAKGHA